VFFLTGSSATKHTPNRDEASSPSSSRSVDGWLRGPLFLGPAPPPEASDL
jgi:hypothetical protein